MRRQPAAGGGEPLVDLDCEHCSCEYELGFDYDAGPLLKSVKNPVILSPPAVSFRTPVEELEALLAAEKYAPSVPPGSLPPAGKKRGSPALSEDCDYVPEPLAANPPSKRSRVEAVPMRRADGQQSGGQPADPDEYVPAPVTPPPRTSVLGAKGGEAVGRAQPMPRVPAAPAAAAPLHIFQVVLKHRFEAPSAIEKFFEKADPPIRPLMIANDTRMMWWIDFKSILEMRRGWEYCEAQKIPVHRSWRCTQCNEVKLMLVKTDQAQATPRGSDVVQFTGAQRMAERKLVFPSSAHAVWAISRCHQKLLQGYRVSMVVTDINVPP